MTDLHNLSFGFDLAFSLVTEEETFCSVVLYGLLWPLKRVLQRRKCMGSVSRQLSNYMYPGFGFSKTEEKLLLKDTQQAAFCRKRD